MWSDRLICRAMLACGAAALLSAGCASSGATPRPFPVPRGEAPAGGTPAPGAPVDTGVPSVPGRVPSPMGALDGNVLSSTALSLRGAPYRNGGSTPDGFDCSGFVQYVFGLNGLAVPRGTREQFGIGHSIDRNHLAPGDLVFFSTVAPGASHVGIAIGNGEFVHAPSSRGVVRVERLSADYWRRRYIGARRPD
ncbi:MAG TPA: NlpC/P60 family protein [Vicinamibacterales bacterium]|nr:NlpC/P60 family protein [Vicinamibacterales bacterium]